MLKQLAKKSILNLEDTRSLIQSGARLLLSGSEKMISNLPAGDWIAGTTPYFMSEQGGIKTHSKIQVSVLPNEVEQIKIMFYDKNEISNLPKNYFENGFSFIILPAFSEVQQVFAKDSSMWPGLFNQPLVGWVAGVDLDETQTVSKVYHGQKAQASADQAIVLHVELKKNYIARTNIINLFTQGQGDVITFPKSGFEIDACSINGQTLNFFDYIQKNKCDTQLPLVANYFGAMINASIRDIDPQKKMIRLFGPVFSGVEYKFALPLKNKYEVEFNQALQKLSFDPLFSCNCILNFNYAKLDGKKIGHLISPMTFGEVAYMLLNQTMVYLTIEQN